ncbi:MAG: hypothetical protein Q9191_002615 [Dirinaria sp. TL-2023a]
MSRSHSRGQAAYFEEYNEDANTTIPGTRQTANVAKKRRQSVVVRSHLVDQVRDEFSDSGYSSRTGATLGSGDSSWLSKPDSRSLRINTNVARDNNGGRRSAEQPRVTPMSPQKPTLTRTNSKATTKPVRQHEGPPPTKPLPPNPIHNAPILQPTQANPRAPTSLYYRTARPMSFHANSIPEAGISSYMHPAYTERPPSAYSNPTIHQASYSIPIVSYSASAQQHVVPPPGSYPTLSSPYIPQPRPQPKQWSSEQARPPGQSLIYSTSPVIESASEPIDPTSASPSKVTYRPAVAQQRHLPQARENSYSRDEDYYRMPPPPVPKKDTSAPLKQRPTIRHAATTSIARPSTHQYRNEPNKSRAIDSTNLQNPRKETNISYETRRRPSLHSRPSTTSNNNAASSAHTLEEGIAGLRIDNNGTSAKQRRRMSLYGHESHQDLERSIEAYQASAGSDGLPMTADSLDLLRKTKSSNSSSRVSGGGRSSRAGSSVKSRSSTDRRGGSDVKSRNDNDGLTMRFNAAHGVSVDFKGASMEGRTISLRQSKDGGEGEMEFSIGAKAGSNTDNKAKSRDKSQKRRSYMESSGRELEPASNSSRSRTAKIKEEIKARGRSVVGSKSRRSSRHGH